MLGFGRARERYLRAKANKTTPVVRTPAIEFDDDIPARCHPDGMGVSHLFNGFSIMATPIEAFFIKRLKGMTAEIEANETNPELLAIKAEVRAFVSQEANHSAIHQKHNRVLEQKGYPVKALQREFFGKLNESVKGLSDMEAYAMVVAGEHFLGEMGNVVVENLALTETMDPKVRALVLWHFYEEIEHKAVAYDAYEAKFGRGLRSYWTRIRMYLKATRFMLVNQPLLSYKLMKADGSFSATEVAKTVWFMTFKSKAWFNTWRSYLAFFSPYYHPWSYKDNSHLLAELRNLIIDETWEKEAVALTANDLVGDVA